MHAARKWRMKTLLGRYKMAVQKQDLFATKGGYGAPMVVGGAAPMQKSARPDVVELGLVNKPLGDRMKNVFGARS